MRSSWHNAVILVIVLLAATSSRAQTIPANVLPRAQPSPTPQASPTPSLEKQFFKNILRDQRAFILSPFHLKKSDARFLVPLGIATSALIATDRRTAGDLSNDETRLRVSRDIGYLGAFYTTGGVAAAFYFVGRATGSARARETGLLGAEALIDSGIDVQVLKTITRRPRPLDDGGRGEFFDVESGNSFPSGHAISAWALATIISEEYHDRPAVRIIVYGLATAVSISRYTGRNHFLSDVLVGSALGYGIGRYVYRTHHDTNSDLPGADKGRPRGSKLFPMISPQYGGRAHIYGVTLAWNL